MRKITAILAGAIVLLAACNKEKDKSAVTKENLVGTYKLIARESQVQNQPPEDDFLTMDPCEKDDLLKLNADMTYTGIDAGTKCNPAGDETGDWSLPSSTQIVMDGETQTIKSFNGRTLVVEYTADIFNTPVRFTTTLAKQ